MTLKRLDVTDRAKASVQASFAAAALTFNLYDKAADDDYSKFPTGGAGGHPFVVTIENEQILVYERVAQVFTVYEENTHALGFLSAGQNGRGFAGTIGATHAGDVLAQGNVISKIIEYIHAAIQANETTIAGLYTAAQVDALLASKNTKDPVEAATTTNVVLSGAQTIDGITLIAGDRVLVKEQTAGAENGIYVVSATAWARAVDMNASAEFNAALVPVKQGSSSADSLFLQTADDPVVDTDAISFSIVGGSVTSVFGRVGAVIAQTGDYIVSQITGAAALISPVFTGTPTAPTPTSTDNSTKIATTNFVQGKVIWKLVETKTFSGTTPQSVTVTGGANTRYRVDFTMDNTAGSFNNLDPIFRINGVASGYSHTRISTAILSATAQNGVPLWTSRRSGNGSIELDGAATNSDGLIRMAFNIGGYFSNTQSPIGAELSIGAANVTAISITPIAATATGKMRVYELAL